MKKFLVIDDREEAREIIADWLEHKYQQRVCLAKDVREALHSIGENKFDLIICDYEMPDGNGLDVLRLIRSRNLQAPTIMFSARFDLELDIEPPLVAVIKDKNFARLFEVIESLTNL